MPVKMTFIAGPLGDVFRTNYLKPKRKDFNSLFDFIQGYWHWQRVLRPEAAISTGKALIDRRVIDPKFWKSGAGEYVARDILEDCVTKAERAIASRGWNRTQQADLYPGVVSVESESPMGYRIEDVRPPTYRNYRGKRG